MYNRDVVVTEIDARLRIALLYFAGGGDEAVDYAEYIRSLRALDDNARLIGAKNALVVVMEPDVPAPSAMSRKKLAEGTTGIGNGTRVALVTTSWWIAGLATATAWIRPRLWEQRIFAHEDHAMAWIAPGDAEAAASMTQMMASARAKVGARRRPKTSPPAG